MEDPPEIGNARVLIICGNRRGSVAETHEKLSENSFVRWKTVNMIHMRKFSCCHWFYNSNFRSMKICMKADFRISAIINSAEHRPSETNSRWDFQEIP